MRQVYPVIFTPLNDKKDTVLIEVPDWEILTEGYGMADAVKKFSFISSISCCFLASNSISL